jgi:hypothetical protein
VVCGLLAFFLGLATLHLWPMPSAPAQLTRLDNNDTAFNTWVIAWVAHQIATDPWNLFAAPIFHPAADALAFSEHLFVQGVMSAPLQWAGISPVTAYNVMVWLGHGLSGFAMALLMRAWTGSIAAGAVSGCLYAFNSHLLTRYAHLQALHLQFFPAVLYLFDRVLRGGTWRHAAILAAMFVLQALCSYYLMVMFGAALLVALLVRTEPWSRDGRLWLHLAFAGIVVAVALLPFLVPYYRVRGQQGLMRTVDDVRTYSAGLHDYFATAGRLHYEAWSHRFFAGSTPLFPGVVGFALTALTIGTGFAWKDSRARMALAFGALGVALSFGTSLPGYAWMQEHITALQAIRAVGRWGLLFLIAVAILSGFAVADLDARWTRKRWWPAVAAVLVALVTIEALRAPLAMQRFEGIPEVHSRLAGEDITALAVFPLYGGSEFHQNAPYLLHQTRHWKPMLNAYSSFAPPLFFELADKLQSFPADDAIRLLRQYRVSHVLLHRPPLEQAYGAAAVDALRQHPALQFVFEDEGVILYRVR